MRCFCLFLWIFIGACSLPAQQDGALLLHQVVTAYLSADTYDFESTTENSLIAYKTRSWSQERDVLIRQGPNQVRFESDGSGGSYFVVSDGKNLWMGSADTREFTPRTISGSFFDVIDGGPLGLGSLARLRGAMGATGRLEENLIRAEQVGTETIEVNNRAIECVIVRADYSPPKGSIGIEFVMRTFWIEAARSIVWRMDTITRGKLFPDHPFEEAESRYRQTYTVASLGQPVPITRFTYTPPPTFKEVDKLQVAAPRPSRDLIGKLAPQVSMRTPEGEDVSLPGLRDRVVLLDFWATWCQPCRNQMPEIDKVYRAGREQGLVVIGIDDDENPEEGARFLKEHGYGWRNVFDGAEKVVRSRFKVVGIPTLVLIDKQGVVAGCGVGRRRSR